MSIPGRGALHVRRRTATSATDAEYLVLLHQVVAGDAI